MKTYYITQDNFVWQDIRDQGKEFEDFSEEIFLVHDDESESLVNTEEDFDKAILNNERLCVEVGFLGDVINNLK